MARKDIKYDLKVALSNQVAFGTKKHELKQKTYQERKDLSKDLKSTGLKIDAKTIQRETDEINYLKDKIFSESTLKTYLRTADRFGDFCIKMAGTRRIDIEDSKQFIQPYIDKLREEGKTPAYQKRELAAICKMTGAYMRDYSHDSVLYAEQLQRKIEHKVINKEMDEKNYQHLLDLNRCLGIRRNDLLNLKVDNIKLNKSTGYLEVYCYGSKGGKNNVNIITEEEKKEVILRYVEIAKTEGRETLLTPEMLKNDVDLHSMRAQNAKDQYGIILKDITENPERRQYYIDMIKKEFESKDKKLDIDFNKKYVCRGKNAEILREYNRDTVYDRVALVWVSVFCLNHWREDVTVQHYLIK